MANLTLADYRSLTLGYMNENRDAPEKNRKIRQEDVDNAINRGRHRLMREVGVSIYRGSDTMDATAGDLTPPADFFSQAVVLFTGSGASDKPTVLVSYDARYMDVETPNWRSQTSDKPSKIVWDFTTSGMRARLYPQPTSTVTDGLTWHYNARLTDLSADSDTCPIMNAFPEFQMTTIQAGALSVLYLLEGGEADDQYQKWISVFQNDVKELQAAIKTISVAPRQIIGNQSFA